MKPALLLWAGLRWELGKRYTQTTLPLLGYKQPEAK